MFVRQHYLKIFALFATTSVIVGVSQASLGAETRDATELDAAPIGAAKVDITPDYPVRLTGYASRKKESEGIATRLWAKALVIGGDQGAGPAVLITVENCGMTPDLRAVVAKGLEAEGVKNERLAISVSHTHTGPALKDWAAVIFGDDLPEAHQKHLDQYAQELAEKMIQVAREALKARRPGRLFRSEGKVGFAANRRALVDGRWKGFGVQADGPVDHSLPVLVAKDLQGKFIAVVANYACHCTTLGGNFNQIAGDWLGYASEYIEQDHPGAVSLITIGCGADANPEPRKDDLKVCQQHGRTLANEVKRLVSNPCTPVPTPIACRLEYVDLPFAALPTKEQWQEKAKQAGPPGYLARKFLALIDQGKEIPKTYSYPVATWVFEKPAAGAERIEPPALAMVFLAGEVVVDYSIRLKSEFDASRLWVTAYANEVPCYIASKRVLQEGGYEADFSMTYYGRPARWAPEVEDIIVDTVQKLLPPTLYSAKKQADFPPPKSPQESLGAMQVKPGFKVELVAAEPLIEDPVAFDWGPDGRLWVVEMRDYPNGLHWKGPGQPLGQAGGRVKVLTDTDGDGRFDHADLFLDGIPFPTGVKVWRKGILVSAAPLVFYAEDRDGDGRADHRETLYEGFGEGNQQHRVNGLRWGIDNWLYLGNGDSGGSIKSTKTGQTLNISGRDLRIRPDTGEMDVQAGQTQFGRCRDDWGNWFGGNNSNPMWHYVLEDHYLRRNPHVAPPDHRKHVSKVPGASPVFPTSKTMARFNDHNRANRFTSACSPEVYRDDLLFPASADQPSASHVFICEPVHNLVHHEVMSAEGITFSSSRAGDDQQSEFLTSTDNWFRPVMVRTGPDGALWVADMYRAVIEHPTWIPVDWQRRLDLRAGSNMGRIYRIVPEKDAVRTPPKFAELDGPLLVAALDSPNGWQRDTVQQLLIWKNDVQVLPALEALAAKPTVQAPTRLHALATLAGLNQLRPEVLAASSKDVHPGVLRHAVRLAESFLNDEKHGASFHWQLSALAQHADPFVQLQVAYSLGESKRPEAGRTLGELLVRHSSNPHFVAAVSSSLRKENLADAFAYVVQLNGDSGPPPGAFERILALSAAMKDKDVLAKAFARITIDRHGTYTSSQFQSLAGLLETFERRQVKLSEVLDESAQQRLSKVVVHAREVAVNVNLPAVDRAAAIRLLGRSVPQREQDRATLIQLVSPRQPPEIQAAAVDTLVQLRDRDVAAELLKGWATHSPTLRAQILDSVTSREEWLNELLAALQDGRVPPNQMDARRRQQLLLHKSEHVRKTAEGILAASSAPSRQKVLEQFASAIMLPGDTGRGKALFAKKCAACHKLDGAGHAVGPDLASVGNKTSEALLVSLLDPNRAIEARYLDYIVVTEDGRQLTGMLGSETSNSITLLGQEGKFVTVLRNEIEEIRNSGKSLMPEGLERELSPQDFADVMAYVRGSGPPAKSFPGNQPALVRVSDDGSFRLYASTARISGPKIVFEEKYRNLGWWSTAEDRAAWSLEVATAGEYRVTLDYACDDHSAGNRFSLNVGGQALGGVVEATGSWDNYRSQNVGSIKLPAGAVELIFRSEGMIRNALIDLRSIRLVPVAPTSAR